MTTARPSTATHATWTPLVRRNLTRERADAFELVEWSERSVQLTEPDGRVAFATGDVEAPTSWSNLAVAVVARRYFARAPDAAPERSVRTLVERVVEAISSWAQDAGHVPGAAERQVLRDELAALVLTQRATSATPVWLNAGLSERPLTSACFILKAGRLDPPAARLEHPGRAHLPAGRRRGDQPLADPLLTRAGLTRRLASGPVSFMRATDAWAATIRAGGRARRGAKMVVLDASHPDILEFIEAPQPSTSPTAARSSSQAEPSSTGLVSLGHTDSMIETLSEYALDHGHLADAPGLRGDERLVFQPRPARPRSPRWHTCRWSPPSSPFSAAGCPKLSLPPPPRGRKRRSSRGDVHRRLAARTQSDRGLPRGFQAPATAHDRRRLNASRRERECRVSLAA